VVYGINGGTDKMRPASSRRRLRPVAFEVPCKIAAQGTNLRSYMCEARPSLPEVAATSHQVVPTEAGYDRWAEIYDNDDNPLILLEEQQIGPLIGDVAGLAVADIGCGTGRHAVRLASAGAHVTAVDFSQEMLRRARMKPDAQHVTFICHDLARPLPLESSSFDRVLCCLVLDHVGELENFFRELGRICRPEGFIVASVMHPAMMLRGVQARFIDPTSGGRISPRSYPHQISDYIMAAVRAGLGLDHLAEHAVDSPLGARSARAQKYLDWPLLLLMRLRAGG
jgi:ubiquinone/menaquinone biosynthesis C-methylase UbiE